MRAFDEGDNLWSRWGGLKKSNEVVDVDADAPAGREQASDKPPQRQAQRGQAQRAQAQDSGIGWYPEQHTDLYLAEIPAAWGEEEVTKIHEDAGVDVSGIRDVKILPMKSSRDLCRAVIVKYQSSAVATAALERLQGRSVTMGHTSTSIVARFATSSQPKGGGKGMLGGKGSGWSGDDWHQGDDWPQRANAHVSGQSEYITSFDTEYGRPPIPVHSYTAHVNLRVRNSKTWRAGTISWVDRDNPGAIWVAFDDGEERERHVSNFETEDGLPLIGPSMQPAKGTGGRTAQAVAGLHIWNANNGRTGVITEALPDGMNIRVQFDDGDVRTRPMWNFESFDGRMLLAAPGGKGGSSWSSGWDWSDSAGKGNASQSWNGYGAGKGKHNARDRWSGPESWSQPPPPRVRQKPARDPDPKLVATALQEIRGQMLSADFDGKVWVTNWPGRFQQELGQLRDFLESHPDLFHVVRKGDRAYTVTAKRQEGGADETTKVATGAVVIHDDEGKDQETKWTHRPSIGTWLSPPRSPSKTADEEVPIQ